MCCPVNGNRVYKVNVCIFRKIWQTMPLKRKLAMADVEKKPDFLSNLVELWRIWDLHTTKKKKVKFWLMKNEFSLQSILLLSLVRRIMVKRDLTESFFPHRNISYLSNKVMKRNDNNKVILHNFQQNKKRASQVEWFSSCYYSQLSIEKEKLKISLPF